MCLQFPRRRWPTTAGFSSSPLASLPGLVRGLRRRVRESRLPESLPTRRAPTRRRRARSGAVRVRAAGEPRTPGPHTSSWLVPPLLRDPRRASSAPSPRRPLPRLPQRLATCEPREQHRREKVDLANRQLASSHLRRAPNAAAACARTGPRRGDASRSRLRAIRSLPASPLEAALSPATLPRSPPRAHHQRPHSSHQRDSTPTAALASPSPRSQRRPRELVTSRFSLSHTRREFDATQSASAARHLGSPSRALSDRVATRDSRLACCARRSRLGTTPPPPRLASPRLASPVPPLSP